MEELINRIAKAPLAVKIGGIGGLVALVTALNFFFFVMPDEDRIQQQAAQEEALSRQLAEKTEIAENLNERRRELETLEQKLQEALTELPERADVDDLLAQLNDVGKKSGLEIARVEPGQESNASFFARIPIRMVVTGNYHEIALFLQEVSNMRRIVNVNNIKLTDPKTDNDKVVLRSEFMATTFRFLDQGGNQGDKGAPAR